MKPSVTERGTARELLLLGAAIFLFYGVLLWAPLIADDAVYILRFPPVSGPWTGFRAFLEAGPNSEQFEPLVHALHRALYALAGARPFAYRFTSLLLHWANAGLVLALFSRLLKDRRLAFLAALLFAVFPAHVETLAGSTCKKHLLVALFTLSALLLTERRPWTAAARVAAGWALFALALASKETAVVLPALVAARLLSRRREPGGPRAAETAALFGGWAALLAGYVLLRLRLPPRAFAPPAGGSFAANALTSAKILAWSLGHLVVPWPLSLEHALAPASWPPGAPALAAALVAAAALAATAVLLRRGGRAAFAAAWVLLALAPFLNLVPYLNYSLVMDRYLYLASAGFFLLLAVALEEAQASRAGRRLRPWIVPALVLAALVYAADGTRYAAMFSSPLEVWENAVRWAPDNPRAREAHGVYLAEQGRDREAVAELRRSIALDPSYDMPYATLAQVEARQGRAAEAAAVVEALTRAVPNAANWAALGFYRLKAGQVEPAVDALRRAAAGAPDDLEVRRDLGYAELAAKRWGDADASLRAAEASEPLRASALAGRGEAAIGEGREREGADLLARAVALDPWNIRAVERLAEADSRLGRRDAALAVLDAALARVEKEPSLAASVRGPLRAELLRRRAALLPAAKGGR
ncbi:MAG TPA: tetratricopeptide repeat protein [Elusimicrobiota bacterium]|nr:tetratricopeptide repeat protein [Elusimicrobiota bacterium]